MFNINPLWVFKLSFCWKLFSISLRYDENPLSKSDQEKNSLNKVIRHAGTFTDQHRYLMCHHRIYDSQIHLQMYEGFNGAVAILQCNNGLMQQWKGEIKTICIVFVEQKRK